MITGVTMDSDVDRAVRRCTSLLAASMEEDFSKEIVQQFWCCKMHLLTTAEVITNVLHKSNNTKQKNNKSDCMDGNFFDMAYINEESKTTRRNAHYKSTVLVMFYYIIYSSYYGKSPKHIGFKHILYNKKAREYMDHYPEIMKKIYSPKRLKERHRKISPRKASRKNKIMMPNGELKPIQHHTQFKQYTYTYRMAMVIDEVMKSIIKYAYEQFHNNCKQFIMINFAKKIKEKQLDEENKRNKRKPVFYQDDDATESEIEETSTSQQKRKLDVEDEESEEFAKPLKKKRHKLVNNEKNINEDEVSAWSEEYEQFVRKDESNRELMESYMQMSINELNISIKIPRVLLKFYQAFLLECDWELLFQFLDNTLTEGFYNATMMRLLIYLMCNVTKVVCVASEREGQNRNLDKLLKQGKYREVISQLHQWSFIHKYSIYTLPQQDIQTNITAYDLKHFKDYARDTRSIHYLKTSVPVNLEIRELEFEAAGIHMKYIEYNSDGCNKVIFDLLKVTLTRTNTKIDLSKMSWQQRLDQLRDIFGALNIKENLAKLKSTNIRAIQYDKLCPGAMYIYVRTASLNGGTLFFTSDKKVRGIHMPKKRFKKLELRDLLLKKLKPKDLGSQMVNRNADNESAVSPHTLSRQQQQLMTHQLLAQLISRITPFGNFLPYDQHQGLQNHLNLLQCKNTSSEQVKPENESPVVSPKHELNLEYLGNLLVADDAKCIGGDSGNLLHELVDDGLKYEEFREEDDF